MFPRNLVLAIGAVVVLGAGLILLFAVNADSEVEVPEDLLAQARDRHARSQAGRPPSPRPSVPSPATRPPPPRDTEAPDERPQLRADEGTEPPRPRRPLAEDMRQPIKDDLNSTRRSIGSLYDNGNYEEALEAARAFLEDNPEERYIRRVAVTSACALGDNAAAHAYFEDMHPTDRPIVVKRCARFGVEL